MIEKNKIIKCSGIKKDGSMCSREKEVPVDFEGNWFCWQHKDGNLVDNDELTDKQKRFCEEYIVDLNATQAAIRAGYSSKTAEAIGFENLKKPKIQKEIERLKEARSKRTEITADRVLKELARIGYSKITDYLEVVEGKRVVGKTETGEPITEKKKVVEIKETVDMAPEVIPAISQIKQTKHGISLKLYDKPAALKDLGRHLELFTDKLDITSKGKEISNLSKEEREKRRKELRKKLGEK